MRSVARELLATCVFRPLMGLVTPYNINKVHQSLSLLSVLGYLANSETLSSVLHVRLKQSNTNSAFLPLQCTSPFCICSLSILSEVATLLLRDPVW